MPVMKEKQKIDNLSFLLKNFTLMNEGGVKVSGCVSREQFSWKLERSFLASKVLSSLNNYS